MTEFYNKYKDLFDGDGPSSLPSSFNSKAAHYVGLNSAAQDQNFKEYKNLFEEDSYQQPKKQYGGGLNVKNYFQDSLDDPQLAFPKKVQQYDDGNQHAYRKSPLNNGQYQYQNLDQIGQFNKFSNQAQDQLRTNSRQSQKRDTLAVNAERLLQQDFSSFNRNSSANQFNDRAPQNIYDNNPAKLGYTPNQQIDNFQNLNKNNNQKQQIQQQKPPLYNMEKFDSVSIKNRDQQNYSPISFQQQQKIQMNNNQNQPAFFNNNLDKGDKIAIKQSESSPVVNMSKQRKYMELHGSSGLNMDIRPQQKQQQDIQENQQQQTQQSGIPRVRGGVVVDNMPKQHYEERNQGLLDVLYLKKKFIDHKVITDLSAFPGQGQYRESLINRIKANKNIEGRKEQLKQLFKQDRVF